MRRYLSLFILLSMICVSWAGSLERAQSLVYQSSDLLDGVEQSLMEAEELRASGEYDAALNALKLIERDLTGMRQKGTQVTEAIADARLNPPSFVEPAEDEDDPALAHATELNRLEEISAWQISTVQIKLAECHLNSAMNYFGLMKELFQVEPLAEGSDGADAVERVREKIQRLRNSQSNGQQAIRLAEQAGDALNKAREMLPEAGDPVLETSLNDLQPRVANLTEMINDTMSDTSESQARAQIELGLVLSKNAQYSQALREIEKAGGFVPGYPLITRATAEVKYVQGMEYEAAGQASRAEGLYGEALSFDPRHFGANLHLGILRLESGNAAEAKDYLTSAMKLKPDNAAPHYYLGLALVATENYREATDEFEEAADLGYGVDCYREWGLAWEALSDNDEAIDAYEDGLKVGGEADPLLTAHLAWLYAVEDESDDTAIRLALQAIEDGEYLEYAWPALVLARHNKRHWEGVVEDAPAALTALGAEFTTQRGVVLYAQARAFYRLKRFDEAQTAFTEAESLLPDWLSRDAKRLAGDIERALR